MYSNQAKDNNRRPQRECYKGCRSPSTHSEGWVPHGNGDKTVLPLEEMWQSEPTLTVNNNLKGQAFFLLIP